MQQAQVLHGRPIKAVGLLVHLLLVLLLLLQLQLLLEHHQQQQQRQHPLVLRLETNRRI